MTQITVKIPSVPITDLLEEDAERVGGEDEREM